MSHALLPLSRWVSHLRLCTVTKEEGKTRNVNVYFLINSIACNELTTACRVWYLKSLKARTLFISYWLICQEIRNEVEVNAPCLSVLGLFGFRKMTYTPRQRKYMRCIMWKLYHWKLLSHRWVSHLRLCTVTKEEGKTRDINVYLLINSIACNELTTACHVW